MKPDDTTLALWLDDELDGDELARIEAWAAQHPEQLALRERNRRWRKSISACLAPSCEPPAAAFFNQRVLHAISRQPSRSEARRGRFQWWLPLAACAAVAVAFLLGQQLPRHSGRQQQVITPANPTPPPPIYTPDPGIQAQWLDNEACEAEVIIVEGLGAIDDQVELDAQGGAPCLENRPAHQPATQP